MHTLAVKSLSRIAIIASLVLAGAGGMLIAGSEPAEALCKGVGAGKCTERDPMAKWKVKINETRIPESNWVDPDCKYYGNCQSPFPPDFPQKSEAPTSSGSPQNAPLRQ